MSFFDIIIDKPNVSYFAFHKSIRKAVVPLKVKVFMQSLAHGSIMTNDMFQKKRLAHFLYTQWCIMCRRNGESMDHLFLHYLMALNLWHCIFLLIDRHWVAPDDCANMLLIDLWGFGGNKKAKTLWHCVVFMIFWVVWLEWNARIIEDKVANLDSLWERVEIFAVNGVRKHCKSEPETLNSRLGLLESLFDC